MQKFHLKYFLKETSQQAESLHNIYDMQKMPRVVNLLEF